MSLSTYYLEYNRHVGQLRRRRAHAPTSNIASHDNHEKINSWVSFSFPYEYGAPLGGPSSRRSSAIKIIAPSEVQAQFCYRNTTGTSLEYNLLDPGHIYELEVVSGVLGQGGGRTFKL